jgi:Gas vesicle synthesis protein GvpL/GvpF
MLYLYAFAERPTRLPDVGGIAGSELALEPVGDIDAIVSDVEADSAATSEETILEHARVVEALAEVSDAVLPARFGRGYADAESLRHAAAEHGPALRDALAHVRGAVELGVRVVTPEPQERSQPRSGREYLLARRDDQRHAERLADALHAPLERLARSATRSVASTPRLLLSAAYLVPRGDVDRFRSAVEELQREHADLTIACTGPWPPYSFALVEATER